MPHSTRLPPIRISEELRAAVDRRARKLSVPLARYIRDLIVRDLGLDAGDAAAARGKGAKMKAAVALVLGLLVAGAAWGATAKQCAWAADLSCPGSFRIHLEKYCSWSGECWTACGWTCDYSTSAAAEDNVLKSSVAPKSDTHSLLPGLGAPAAGAAAGTNAAGHAVRADGSARGARGVRQLAPRQ